MPVLATLQSAVPKHGLERGHPTPTGCVPRGMQASSSETPSTQSFASDLIRWILNALRSPLMCECRSSFYRAIVPQSTLRQRGPCRELSSSRPAAMAVAVAPIVIAPIIILPVAGAPVDEAFFFGWWTPEPQSTIWCLPIAMVRGTRGPQSRIYPVLIYFFRGLRRLPWGPTCDLLNSSREFGWTCWHAARSTPRR